ncbi:MAG: hypothetical protein ACOCUI_03335, partial [bacterium]
LVLLQAENQIRVAEKVDGKTIKNLGCANQISFKNLKENINQLLSDFELRRAMGENNIIDHSFIKWGPNL